jgi:hypothetical protein
VAEQSAPTVEKLVPALSEHIESSTLRERIALFGDSIDEVLAVIESVYSTTPPDSTLLPVADADLLDATGIPAAPPDVVAGQRSRLVEAFGQQLADSLTVEELAGRIGVSAGRVRQRLNREQTLWGFKTAPGLPWRIPRWEVEGPQLLPGIEVIAAAIPAEMHPVAVAHLVTDPNPDLEIDGDEVSVRDWLLVGNDPAKAAAAIGDPTDRN